MTRFLAATFIALIGFGAAPSACLGVLAQESQVVESFSNGTLGGASLVALPTQNDAEAVPNLGDDDLVFGISKEREQDIVNRAYPLRSAQWPFNTVFVCWEEDDPQFAPQRALVRQAIEQSWEAHSALKFVGDWQVCNAGTEGIRIHIEDVGPHVKFLGKFVSGVEHGMVLNFTYNTWSPRCRTMQDFCNRAIAVHEFGHAIGFAHEQNRPDTPGECNKPAQGGNGDILLTPWDLHSVMNYCNPEYANSGALSEFDIQAVQYIYGAPQ